MNGDLARIDELFNAARRLPADARDAYLEANCDDPTLRRRVAALLARDAASHALLDRPVALGPEVLAAGAPGANDDDALPPPPSRIPERIGPYRILGTIGVGGMGVVYRAEQPHPRRTVALKVIRPGALTRGMLRRFEHETHVLGLLRHPGIAQIFEAGTADTGAGAQPFFAMELVEGRPLLEHADAHRLDVRARLALLARICDAVHHAHQKGVVHRDLKPANVLVEASPPDGPRASSDDAAGGQPKVLDFGIARAIDADVQLTTMHTDVGQLVGTVPYMSPEQITGDPDAIDTRSDVYALGVLGYELLTGRLPHDVRERPVTEALRIIGDEDPTPLGTIDRAFRGDLDTIVGRALERDKTRRYQSASELAEDVRRYLRDEPIVAHPPSTLYQLGKFAKRNRTLVGAIAAVFAILVVAVIVSLVLLVDARTARRREAQGAAEARWQSYAATISAADNALRAGEPAAARVRLQRAPDALRGWEWSYLATLTEDSSIVVRVGEVATGMGSGPVVLAALSHDGERMITGARDGALVASSVRTGERLETIVEHMPESWSIAMSDDERYFAWDAPNGVITLLDVRDGTQRALAGHTGRIQALRFAPAGARIASVADDGELIVWDSVTGTAMLRSREHDATLRFVAFSPDGGRLATGAEDGSVVVWNARTAEVERRLNPHRFRINELALSPDGRLLATAGADRSLCLTEVATGTRRHRIAPKDSDFFCVAFSPDGRLVAGGQRTRVGVFDVASGVSVAALDGHTDIVRTARFTPDGQRLVTGSYDGTARLWDLRESGEGVLVGHDGRVNDVAFSPDGARVASVGADGTLRIFDAATGAGRAHVVANEGWTLSVAFSPDGALIATGGADNVVRIWDAETLIERHAMRGHEGWVLALAFAPDGASLASGAWDGTVRLWDPRTGTPSRTFVDRHDDAIMAIAFAPDGLALATAAIDGTVGVWNVSTGRRAHVLRGHDRDVYAVAFSPDGTLIASGADDDAVRLWDARTGAAIGVMRGHVSAIQDVVFSPDGARVVSASLDHTLRIWDVTHRESLLTLRGHDDHVTSVAFSADGTRIVSGSMDQSVRVWDRRGR